MLRVRLLDSQNNPENAEVLQALTAKIIDSATPIIKTMPQKVRRLLSVRLYWYWCLT